MSCKRMRASMVFVLVLVMASAPLRFTALAASSDAVVRIMDENERVVYLTFDDGPDDVNTVSVMETLMKYDVPATFFFIGRNMKIYPEVVKQVYDNGFPIGNHTANHKTLSTLSAAGVKEELDGFNNLLETLVGERSAIMRPPGGGLNDATKKTIASLGYKTYMWTIDPRDWSNKDNSVILSEVKQNLKPGAVILLHASSSHRRASQILPELIEYIKAEGYEMRALPDPGYKSMPARFSASEIQLNGARLNISPYLIGDMNYVNIRDFANAINRTQKRFGIRWHEKTKRINLLTDSHYSGTSVKNGAPEARRAKLSPVTVTIDGNPAAITVFSINGSSYFNLAQLTRSLGIALSYDRENNIVKLSAPVLSKTR